MHVHDVFHVSVLSPWVPGRVEEPPLPAMLPAGSTEYDVDAVIADLVHRDKT